MRILIDADASPVVQITEEIAIEYDVDLYIFSDINHYIESDYANVVRIDEGKEAVDLAIYNFCQNNDIIITQDYGLASLVLSKNAGALSPEGIIFTEKNINYFLTRRHINASIRRAGGKHKKIRKRKSEDNLKYKKALIKLLKKQI
jgi:uncharacterized protein